MEIPFTEKFRPTEFNDIYNNNNINVILQNCLEKKDIPHFLFHGNSGNGKTTSVRSFLKKLYNNNNNSSNNNILYLNASDDRGINIVREKIKTFSKLSTSNDCIKIIVLDEADNMTYDAQSALRRIMEIYSKNTRFIIVCNFVNKIIEPIISRCCIIKFNSLTNQQIDKIINNVEEKMNFHLDNNIKNYIIKETNGDARKTLNILEFLYYIFYKDNAQNINNIDIINKLNDLTGNIDDDSFKKLITDIENSSSNELSILIRDFINQSYDTNKIIKRFIKHIFDLQINNDIKNNMISKFHNLLRKIYEGTPEDFAIRNVIYQYKFLYHNYI
jgi:replication factor C subunit 2/4